MNRLLQRTDIFRVSRIKDSLRLVYRTRWDGNVLRADRNVITLDHSDTVGWLHHQRRPGGWERSVSKQLNISAVKLAGATWRVVRTEMTGGGTGHGPHDVYPNGHFVVAENINQPGQVLEFYQSGCFIPEIMPEDIELVGAQGRGD